MRYRHTLFNNGPCLTIQLYFWFLIGLLLPLMLSVSAVSYAQEAGGDTLIGKDRDKGLTGEATPAPTRKQAELKECLNTAQSLGKNKQYQDALRAYRQALSLQRDMKDSAGEATTWDSMGRLFREMGDYDQALDAFQKTSAIRTTLNDSQGVARALVNIGVLHFDQGRYARALEYYEKARNIYETSGLGNTGDSAISLNNLALTYTELGQYAKALELYNSALQIFEKTKNTLYAGKVLHNSGYLCAEQNKVADALQYYERALEAKKATKDAEGIASTLNNMGHLYSRQGNVEKALEVLHQALSLSREHKERVIEARTLDSIGDAFLRAKKYPEALDVYNEALVIRRQMGDRRGETITLTNIGRVWQEQGEDSLAISFYKQAVNVSESIRGELGGLPSEIRTSYATKVSEVYRCLIDLLLKDGRVAEAQQVIDLLKVQEIENYLQVVRGNDQTREGIVQLPGEKQISDRYDEMANELRVLLDNLKELRELESRRDLTAAEKERKSVLTKKRLKLADEFSAFRKSDEVREWKKSRSKPDRQGSPKLKSLIKLQDNLGRMQKAILLYTLVLQDRLELVLVTPDGPPVHEKVAIKRTELNELIKDFRKVLHDAKADPKPLARELYNKILKPIEPALADAKTILYAPDQSLRYIPLSALYDGKHWLAERFAVHRITASSLDDLNDKPSGKLRVLAGAFGTEPLDQPVAGVYFSGLRFARAEVENLAKTISDTDTMFDRDFTPKKTQEEAGGHTIIHLATHAIVLPGRPDESFILFGNGDRLTLKDLDKEWNGVLGLVKLVVLSACETGIGGNLETGDEILGFGYLMEQAGAEATIATLWSVDDGGTQVLMNAFYANLGKKGVTKAEALRQAQLTLIGSDEGGGVDNRGVVPVDGVPTLKGRLSHPYYWAPFMLIGNGL
jgi:CHAT domain-containing protein/Tfp pilus assembly protein PilF